MSKAKSVLIKRHNSSTAGGMIYISLVNDIYLAMSLPVAYWLEHPTGERIEGHGYGFDCLRRAPRILSINSALVSVGRAESRNLQGVIRGRDVCWRARG